MSCINPATRILAMQQLFQEPHKEKNTNKNNKKQSNNNFKECLDRAIKKS